MLCPALRFALDAGGELSAQRVEPLAADLRPGRDGKSDARLNLVAGLIGIDFDDLKQRERVRRRWRRAQVAAAALVLAVGIGVAWMVISDYRQEARPGAAHFRHQRGDRDSGARACSST